TQHDLVRPPKMLRDDVQELLIAEPWDRSISLLAQVFILRHRHSQRVRDRSRRTDRLRLRAGDHAVDAKRAERLGERREIGRIAFVQPPLPGRTPGVDHRPGMPDQHDRRSLIAISRHDGPLSVVVDCGLAYDTIIRYPRPLRGNAHAEAATGNDGPLEYVRDELLVKAPELTKEKLRLRRDELHRAAEAAANGPSA